jgi:hypothetical protein
MAIKALVGGLSGLAVGALLLADARAHQLLADPRRRRKRQVFWPTKCLS